VFAAFRKRSVAAVLLFAEQTTTSRQTRSEFANMMAIYGPLDLILSIAYWFVIVHVIMSWLINFQVLNLNQQFVAQLWYGLNKLLEPIYRPIRNVMPDLGGIDLTPLVVFIIIISLRSYILPTLFGLI
jgi:YggT family protein